MAAHLFEWFDEYGGYHRISGKVNKVDDDLMSATRVACMDLSAAKTADRFPKYLRAAASTSVVADGIDFDVFATSA